MKLALKAVRAEAHFEIGSLIQRESHAIVDRWCALARDEERPARRAHHVVLRDELPAFLEGVGRALMHEGQPDASPQDAAREHGDQRWDSGWSLGELVRDYQILRVVILDSLEDHLRRPLYYREAMAVGVFIDDAIAESIVRYVAHRDEALRRIEQERAETLEELGRRKDEFLAILGHELRNPLAPIRNSLMVIRKVVDVSHPAVATSLDVLDRQSQQLGRLVDDMLDIARIGRREFELRKTRMALRSAIEQALQMTDELVKGRGLTLHVSIPQAPIPLEADAQRVCQVVANLLNNAAKYTDPGGNIWLTAALDEGSATIRVRDDGIGIEPDMLSRVFELFVRADSPQAAGREGLGIGLSLVQRLVEQHGGTISAHSAGLGLGTEFVVRLPAAPAEAGVEAPTSGNTADAARTAAPAAATADNQLLVITQVPVDKT